VIFPPPKPSTPRHKLQPSVSIIIPTLNAATVLPACLSSIRQQHYPQTKIDIIIADGGSTDTTLLIAQQHHCRIFSNPLQTAESGKAVGLQHANSEYIAFIDSDNILPTPDWLTSMLNPLVYHPQLIGSEPWKFTYRPQAGFIERYSALIGANDPYAFVVGAYDRLSCLSGHWTGLRIDHIDHVRYIEVILHAHQFIPTIGANGTIFRRQFLRSHFQGQYLFDIDLITSALESTSPLRFAKVRVGIIHTFCEASILKFARKQRRRLFDLYFYQSQRRYRWNVAQTGGPIKYLLYTILIIPMLFDTLKGFIKHPDLAWFFHPLACLISLYYYVLATTVHLFGFRPQISRHHWQQ
jgi:glycosyltransferase involved in cell wall biosynthesis